MADSFRILHPARQTSAVVFASPHSGRDYSAAFLDQSLLGADAIRTSEDAFVDQLFADAPRFGAPLMVADVPRAFLDLNRAPDELDPAVITEEVDYEILFRTHRAAISKAIGKAMRNEPTIDWLLENQDKVTHCFHQMALDGEI